MGDNLLCAGLLHNSHCRKIGSTVNVEACSLFADCDVRQIGGANHRTIPFFGSVSDPYSFDTDTDPAFRLNTDPDPDPIRIQSFDDQKLEKFNFFRSIIYP